MADGERVKLSVGWLVTWPLTLVFAAMVFLSVEEMRRPAERVAPTMGGSDWAVHFPQRIDAITDALQRAPTRLPEPVEERQGAGNLRWIHRHYDVAIDPDKQAETEEFITSLYDVDPGVTVSTKGLEGGVEVRVGLDGLLTHTLRFKWEEQAPPPPPRVALIVDTLGDDLYIARQFVGLDVPVAFAVRPFRPFSKEVAELARLSKREVLLHLPSTSEALTATGETDAGADPTTADAPMTPARQAEAVLISVPNAVGMIAESPTGDVSSAPATDPLVVELERRGLFRVGQAAQAPSTGEPKPTRAVPADIVTLSDGDGTAPSAKPLSSLASRAREKGVAIGLTRPTPEALEALRAALTEWQSAGIEIVPISGVMAPVALSAR